MDNKTKKRRGPKQQIIEIEDVIEPFIRRHTVLLSDYDFNIASEWCYKRNCGFGPDHFSYGSGVRAWFTCPDCHRDYKARICNRVSNQSGCPYCASKKICSDNSLADLYPEVAKEWHPTKNKALTPSDVTYGSNKRYWWKCREGHSWVAAVADRTVSEAGCPHCYEADLEYRRANPPPRIRERVVLNGKKSKVSRVWYELGRIRYKTLAETRPDIAAQWHPTRNDKWTPNDFARASEAKVWWLCDQGPDHEWQAQICSRTSPRKGGTCPFCAWLRVSITNSLASVYPEVAKKWHPTNNGKLRPMDVIAHPSRKYWWKCTKGAGHEWQSSIGSMTDNPERCPFCIRLKVDETNNLKTKFPSIAAEWHPTRNKGLTPDMVAPMSRQKAWWVCSTNPRHIWQAQISNRTHRGSGCPTCAGKKPRHLV